jgi:hypothetical protein
MRRNIRTSIPLLLCCIGLGAVIAAHAAVRDCVSNPSTAIGSVRTSASLSSAQNSGDYRVQAYRWDPILLRKWLTIANCNHPERPTFAILAHEENDDLILDTASSRRDNRILEESPHALPALVRAGDIVRLWRQEDNVRIEAIAVSEESGSLGKSVRVRLVQVGNPVEQQFIGVISGPADVELRR